MSSIQVVLWGQQKDLCLWEKKRNKPSHENTSKMSAVEVRRGQRPGGGCHELQKVQSKRLVNSVFTYGTQGPNAGTGQLRVSFFILWPRSSQCVTWSRG